MSARNWSRRTLFIAAACVVAVVALAVFALQSRTAEVAAQVPFSDLLRHVDRGDVTEVVVSGDTLEFKLAAGQTLKTVMPANYATVNSAFVPELARKNIRIDVRTASEPPLVTYGSVLASLGLLAVLAFAVYRMTGGRILALEHKTQEAGREQTDGHLCRCGRRR